MRASPLRPERKSDQVLWVVGGGASVLLQMAQKVGEESLVLCSEWVKTGIEYKASLGGGGSCRLQELPRRG